MPSGTFAFEYTITEETAGFQSISITSYDSKTNILSIKKHGAQDPDMHKGDNSISQKQLQESQINNLKQMILQNEFFKTKEYYQARILPPDPHITSLTITLDSQSHSTKWERGSEEPVGLDRIAVTIENL
jgi:hypothetical protein